MISQPKDRTYTNSDEMSCDSSGGTEMMEYFSPKKNGRPNFFTNPGEIEKKFGEVPHDQQ